MFLYSNIRKITMKDFDIETLITLKLIYFVYNQSENFNTCYPYLKIRKIKTASINFYFNGMFVLLTDDDKGNCTTKSELYHQDRM